MNKLNVGKMFKTARRFVTHHSPEILTGIGVAGMITTTVLAVKATPKALDLIEKEKNRQNREVRKEAAEKGQDACPQISKLKPVDVVKVAWKPYIPAAIAGVASATCLISAITVSARRNAALVTAYKLSETALTEYRDKVVETVGEETEKTIQHKIDEERIAKSPVVKKEVIITGNGDTLFCDALSGRYFKSDKETIRASVNNLNLRMRDEMYISISDFYDELGLDHTSISDMLGWNIDKGYIDVDYVPHDTKDGKLCYMLRHNNPPIYDYD